MIGGKLQKQIEGIKTSLRKGDRVQIVAGKERGKAGKILNISRIDRVVWVEQLNLIKKHTRPNPKYPQGGILEREAPIAISNVMIVCPNCERPVRLGKKQMTDGKKVRICRRCHEPLDKG